MSIFRRSEGIMRPESDELAKMAKAEQEESEEVTKAKNILNNTKLTEAASYWSGMPANRKNYTEADLQTLYNMIKKEVNPSAAHSFANMVLDMPSLAPSNLIRSFLSLSRNNWIYDPRFSERILAGEKDARPVKPDQAETREEIIAEGFFGKIASNDNSDEDETNEIRNGFKQSLGEEELKKIESTREVIDVDSPDADLKKIEKK